MSSVIITCILYIVLRCIERIRGNVAEALMFKFVYCGILFFLDRVDLQLSTHKERSVAVETDVESEAICKGDIQ